MSKPEAIQPVKNAENNFIKLGVYGEPGVGKSVLAGTGRETLILANDDDETSSAAIHGSTADRWVIRDYDDLEEAYTYVRHEGVREYKWVWIDNLTLFQDQGLDHIMADLIAAKPMAASGEKRNPWVPDKPQYLQNQNHLATMIRQFKALPIHFGWTAHVMRIIDQDGEVLCLPLLQGGTADGKFSQKICGYMGMIGYLYAVRRGGKVERHLMLDKRSKYLAKDRYSIPKNSQGELIDPTIPKLMAGIRKQLPTLGQLNGSQRPVAKKVTTKKTAAKRITPRKRSN